MGVQKGILLTKRIVKAPFRMISNSVLNGKAEHYIRKMTETPVKDRIKVGFIVQMPELWDKQSSVYAKMAADPDFDVTLIIVPAYDLAAETVGEYSSEKEFFCNACLNGSYILAKDGDRFVDISQEGFDFLFYQRPYDHYLPDTLKSSTAVRFTRACYVPYATPEIKKTSIYPVNFFRNLYFGFMEDSGAAEVNMQQLHKNSDGVQHFMSVGYPPFEKCMTIRSECRYRSFLWTPRWSYDPVVGGSHFLEYYQQLTDYDWGDAELTVRPHPMMWDNFIKNNFLTAEQAETIRQQWAERHIPTDQNKSIEDTFVTADVMISDRSSVIPMFFLTGKPVIYCPIECEYGSLFSAILPGLYLANDWSELEKYIRMLSAHEDPLLETRQKIIAEYFGSNQSATDNIVQAIKKESLRLK